MNRLTLLLIVALALSIAINVIREAAFDRIKEDRSSLQSIAKSLSTEAKVWKDKESRSHYRAIVAEGNIQTIKEVFNAELSRIAKDVSGLKKNLKNLESYTVTTLATKTEIKTGTRDTIVFKSDSSSVTGQTFKWDDKWLSVSGMFIENRVDMEYKSRDSLAMVSYYKRPYVETEVISYNPNTEITGVKSIKVKVPPPSNWGLGVYAGYGMSNTGLTPQVGIGVYCRLIQF